MNFNWRWQELVNAPSGLMRFKKRFFSSILKSKKVFFPTFCKIFISVFSIRTAKNNFFPFFVKIHQPWYLKFLGLTESPNPQGIPIPSVGGVRIFSGHTHCDRHHKCTSTQLFFYKHSKCIILNQSWNFSQFASEQRWEWVAVLVGILKCSGSPH